MTQRQITELPSATSPDGSELLIIRQDVLDKKLPLTLLKDYLSSVFNGLFLQKGNNLTDVTDATIAFDNIKQQATTDATGVVELATTAEAAAGTDTSRAVTPAGVAAAVAVNVPVATTSTQGKVELATNTETLTGTDTTRAVTPSALKYLVDEMFRGQVAAFAYGVAPSGWLKCNGAAVSRTTYAALFAKIGTTYGSGDGSTTFNLPDMRGEFLRGFDDARGVDANRVLGSSQTEQFKKHSHLLANNSIATQELNSSLQYITDRAVNIAADNYDYQLGGTDSLPNVGKTGDSGEGTETRPRNIAMLYCIKY